MVKNKTCVLRGGGGGAFREWKRTRVSFYECRAVMEALSLRHHMERYHSIIMTWTWGGGSRQRKARDLCDVLPTCVKISGVPIGQVPDEGIQPGKT